MRRLPACLVVADSLLVDHLLLDVLLGPLRLAQLLHGQGLDVGLDGHRIGRRVRLRMVSGVTNRVRNICGRLSQWRLLEPLTSAAMAQQHGS